MRRRGNHGSSLVEFVLLAPFLASMIIGTMVYGTQMVKELELQQVARDTASMSARGTNFMSLANQQIVARLGQELGWPTSGGLLSTSPGVVYVSTVEYLDSTCNGNPGCANHDSWVFLRSVAFGQKGLKTSNFGAPAGCLPTCADTNRDDGSLKSTDTLNNAGARVSNFTYLGTPDKTVTGFQPGQPAYLIEVAGVTGPWNGGSVSYAISIF